MFYVRLTVTLAHVTKRPNIFVDQGQLSDLDFINDTHLWKNAQFADKVESMTMSKGENVYWKFLYMSIVFVTIFL